MTISSAFTNSGFATKSQKNCGYKWQGKTHELESSASNFMKHMFLRVGLRTKQTREKTSAGK